VALDHLAVAVLHHIGARAVQQPALSRAECRPVPSRFDALAAGFRTEQCNLRQFDELAEDADRVAAAANTREDRIRQPADRGRPLFLRLARYHTVEVAH
jgi:hypothetical protein